MAIFVQDIHDNIAAFDKRLKRLEMARLGHVSVGPGEGHLRAHDGTRTTALLAPTGASILYRGSLTDLTWLTETFATGIEGHTATLAAHAGRLAGNDSAIASHNTRINNAQTAANTANSRAATLEGQMPGKAAVSYVDTVNARAGAAQSRADAAYARAGTGISNAATAQARADAAHALASGRATQSQISDLNGRITTLAGRLDGIVTFLRSKYNDVPGWLG